MQVPDRRCLYGYRNHWCSMNLSSNVQAASNNTVRGMDGEALDELSDDDGVFVPDTPFMSPVKKTMPQVKASPASSVRSENSVMSYAEAVVCHQEKNFKICITFAILIAFRLKICLELKVRVLRLPVASSTRRRLPRPLDQTVMETTCPTLMQCGAAR